MWLNYPNNPTGAVADLGFLSEAVGFRGRHEILLCYDAPYCDVTYDGYVAPSILQVDGARDVVVEFNSLSKTYQHGRVAHGDGGGQCRGPRGIGNSEANVDSGMFHPLQEAAVQALSIDAAWIEARNAIYLERLRILEEGLAAIGMKAALPRAGLYLWVSVPGGDAESFASRSLNKPGWPWRQGPFLDLSGSGYIRISATAPTELDTSGDGARPRAGAELQELIESQCPWRVQLGVRNRQDDGVIEAMPGVAHLRHTRLMMQRINRAGPRRRSAVKSGGSSVRRRPARRRERRGCLHGARGRKK